VVTERCFRGLASVVLAIQGIYNRDYPVGAGIVFIAAAFFVLINFVVDLLYTILDRAFAMSKRLSPLVVGSWLILLGWSSQHCCRPMSPRITPSRALD